MLVSHHTEAFEGSPSAVSLMASLTDEGGSEVGAEMLIARRITLYLGEGEDVESNQAKGCSHNTR